MRSIYTAIREVVQGIDDPELPELADDCSARYAVTGARIALCNAHHERTAAMDDLYYRVCRAEDKARKDAS